MKAFRLRQGSWLSLAGFYWLNGYGEAGELETDRLRRSLACLWPCSALPFCWRSGYAAGSPTRSSGGRGGLGVSSTNVQALAA